MAGCTNAKPGGHLGLYEPARWNVIDAQQHTRCELAEAPRRDCIVMVREAFESQTIAEGSLQDFHLKVSSAGRRHEHVAIQIRNVSAVTVKDATDSSGTTDARQAVQKCVGNRSAANHVEHFKVCDLRRVSR